MGYLCRASRCLGSKSHVSLFSLTLCVHLFACLFESWSYWTFLPRSVVTFFFWIHQLECYRAMDIFTFLWQSCYIAVLSSSNLKYTYYRGTYDSLEMTREWRELINTTGCCRWMLPVRYQFSNGILEPSNIMMQIFDACCYLWKLQNEGKENGQKDGLHTESNSPHCSSTSTKERNFKRTWWKLDASGHCHS